MSDDQRVYSDEEFALILRKATELASRAQPDSLASGGLTLGEMKAAAAQVGLDPALVERAARLLIAEANASPIERLIGGPLRHEHELRFPVKLDKNTAAQLLSAAHISAGQSGKWNPGHSSAIGMTFSDGGEMETLKVTARPEEDGTSVSVVLDRRGTLFLTGVVTGMGMLFAFLFSVFALYPESPAQGIGGLVIFTSGFLAAARGFWASSTRKARERVAGVMDVLGRAFTQTVAQPSKPGPLESGTATRDADGRVADKELTGA